MNTAQAASVDAIARSGTGKEPATIEPANFLVRVVAEPSHVRLLAGMPGELRVYETSSRTTATWFEGQADPVPLPEASARRTTMSSVAPPHSQ
jgi:hypothetical protein